ncbi:unnamed protein product [Linum tenue]|uniref:Gustatory receptor n=1 Tax=Linum tenue TaxID=586396 RepID=A0AAV0GV61_9ROSI|nr:unnamed protein product [Linum tenue]
MSSQTIHSSDCHVTFHDQTPLPSSSSDSDHHDHRPLLLRPSYARSKSLLFDELRSFRISLKWCALDHSTPLGRSISYLTFFSLAVLVPILTSLSYHDDDQDNESTDDLPLSFNKLVQIPESGLALISFLTLTSFFRRYGLRHLLFLDGLHADSPHVRRGYSLELHRAFRYLAAILLPSFFLQLAHKIVFFSTVRLTIPLPASACLPVDSIMFLLVMGSWVYRTGVFLLVCVLFRLTCELQIMRFQGLHQLFQGFEYSDGSCDAIYGEHVRIKKQLRFTSHRYRSFIIACLVTITVSQLGALLLILASRSHKSFLNSGDLVVICSAVQLSGLFLCLMGAARITHRAQGIVSLATRWNMIVTSTGAAARSSGAGKGTKNHASKENSGSDGDSDDTSSSSTSEVLISVSVDGDHNGSSSFQTRQALVAYLQHNNGGITLFGFPLDRGLLHTLFAFEFSLVLWILSKVVVL